MTRRTATGMVAQRVAAAIELAGATPATVAAATDIELSDLEARLRGDADFTVPELFDVGGFLCFPFYKLVREEAA